MPVGDRITPASDKTLKGAAPINQELLVANLRESARNLGFSQIGIADVNLETAEPGLLAWLAAGFQGEMGYLATHGIKRARPQELVPGTVRVITARMDYLPADAPPDWRERETRRLLDPRQAVISVYARGRDYHRVMRQRLQRLADELASTIGPFGFRVFCDSAPVLECELATRSGQGWRGKHTLVLQRAGGSMFFLGEIYVDLPLPITPPGSAHCGSCTACISACPTGAIVAPYRLDARRCISYLTIELRGAIPEALRASLGNRIYGCDDCQTACPWNKYAVAGTLPDFNVRHGLDQVDLLTLWSWQENEFLSRTEGSPIRRIGFERWQRNLAVALGNALRQRPDDQPLISALQAQRHRASALVAEHIDWSLRQATAAA